MQIIILGCGKVGRELASVLSFDDHEIAIVDNDEENFRKLDDEFMGFTLKGIPIDQDVLLEAGVETCDILIAVTSDDNTNLMACEIAKNFFHVKKVLARVYDPDKVTIFQSFGIDIICPTHLTIDALRAHFNIDSVVSTTFINQFEFNFITVYIEEEDDGKIVKNISTDKSTHIFGIMRNNHFEFSFPDTVIHTGDVLIVSECIGTTH